MSIFFRVLSAAYIAGIFLFADSRVVYDMATFNPYSLLHIPLYGILTFLLILSFSPSKRKSVNSRNSIDPTNSSNTINPTNSSNLSNPNYSINYLIAGVTALVVAVADEIHQAFIPTRNASLVDVILDFVGIILFLILIRHLENISWFSKRVSFFFRKALEK